MPAKKQQGKKKTDKKIRKSRDASVTKDNARRNLLTEARKAEKKLEKLRKRGELTPYRERRLEEHIADCQALGQR